MQPHTNLGINFRKHFQMHPSKKRELDAIRREEKRVNKAYYDHTIERTEALYLLDKLAYAFYSIKGKL